MSYKEYSLSEIQSFDPVGSVDGPFGSNLPASSYQSSGIPVIRGINLSLGIERFKDFNYVFVSEQTAEKLERSSCEAKDIIFTKKGTLGQTGIVPSDSIYESFILSSNQMRLRVNTNIACPDYVYYFLSSKSSQNRILADAMTAGVPKINLTYLRNFKILLPKMAQQKKIAAILSAYDDLIENNKRRIALLEKMAEEIYREWFVRFRFPGYETAEFEKGIPKGWKSIPSIEALDVLSGGTPKTNNPSYWDGEIPFFTPKDATDKYYCFTTEKRITSSGLDNCNSSLYPKNTIFITARGTVGKISLASEKMAMNQSCYALRPKSGKHEYYWFLAMNDSVNQIKGISKSGVFDNIIVDTFKIIQLLQPSDSVLCEFNKIISDIFENILNLSKTNLNLEKTKNLLLPRLISGKLSVEDLDIRFPPSMR